jgi:putative flippase GtrA
MPSNSKSDMAGLLKQVFRFSLTGLLSTLINFIIYILVYSIFESLIVASIFGYSVGLINTYFMGRSWVFNVARKVYFNEILIFLAIYIAGGMGMTAIIYFSDLYFLFDYRVSWCLGAIYAVVNNFIGSKFFVFKNK